MEKYRKVRKDICNVFRWIMAACLFVLVVLATVQVVTRYFVAVTIVWVEELSIYLMNWMCAIGVAWVWLENCSHIKMDVLDNILSRRTIRLMDAGIDIVTAAMGFATVKIGLRTWQTNHGMVMSVINLDEGNRYLPVIVGGALLLFAAFYMLVEHIYLLTKKGESEA